MATTKSEGTHKVPETKTPPKAAAKAPEPEPKPAPRAAAAPEPEPTPDEEAAELAAKVEVGDVKVKPDPPEGYTWRLIRGEYCLAQNCPCHLEDPMAQYATPGPIPGT